MTGPGRERGLFEPVIDPATPIYDDVHDQVIERLANEDEQTGGDE